MLDILAGRNTAFLWYYSAFNFNPETVSELLQRGGMSAVMVKSHDGSTWFNQHESFRRIRYDLKNAGVELVGSWGYHYFHDVAGETQRVLDSIGYGESDFHVLNIEDPAIERNPRTAELAAEMFATIRGHYPDYPLYFCCHAQPRYHTRQPYYQAVQADIAMMPMAYHTAMEVSPDRAVSLTREGLAEYSLDSVPANYAGGVYSTSGWPILPGDVTAWGIAALAAGATGLSWWDLVHLVDRPDLVDAIRQIPMQPSC